MKPNTLWIVGAAIAGVVLVLVSLELGGPGERDADLPAVSAAPPPALGDPGAPRRARGAPGGPSSRSRDAGVASEPGNASREASGEEGRARARSRAERLASKRASEGTGGASGLPGEGGTGVDSQRRDDRRGVDEALAGGAEAGFVPGPTGVEAPPPREDPRPSPSDDAAQSPDAGPDTLTAIAELIVLHTNWIKGEASDPVVEAIASLSALQADAEGFTPFDLELAIDRVLAAGELMLATNDDVAAADRMLAAREAIRQGRLAEAEAAVHALIRDGT